MNGIHIITYDELVDQKCTSEHLDTIDLGAMALHVVRVGDRKHILVENPANDEQALILLPA